MTQDEIIKMAKQAGFAHGIGCFAAIEEDIVAFAKLVAEKEREEWRNAAIRVGENLATCGPAGYYDYTSQQWLDWALDATTKMQDDYMNLGACGEREACAKIADEWAVGWPHPSQSIAEWIRKRGQV